MTHVCKLMGMAQESTDEDAGDGGATGTKRGWGPRT